MSLADELITRGWTQGHSEDDEGRVCLTGAAAYASTAWRANSSQFFNADTTTQEQYTIYMEALTTAVRHSGYLSSVISFNDTPGRTFDEVLRVAKEADEMIDNLKELNASSQSSADRITGES